MCEADNPFIIDTGSSIEPDQIISMDQQITGFVSTDTGSSTHELCLNPIINDLVMPFNFNMIDLECCQLKVSGENGKAEVFISGKRQECVKSIVIKMDCGEQWTAEITYAMNGPKFEGEAHAG